MSEIETRSSMIGFQQVSRSCWRPILRFREPQEAILISDGMPETPTFYNMVYIVLEEDALYATLVSGFDALLVSPHQNLKRD